MLHKIQSSRKLIVNNEKRFNKSYYKRLIHYKAEKLS